MGRNQERRVTGTSPNSIRLDAFVTVDRNLAFQQNTPQFTIAVVVLQAPTNRLKDLRPLLPKLQQILPIAPKGEVSRVSL